ncbi:hypothetical protein ANTQUA_LOCUS2667, partial [Anthophora quadrimaculata]
MRARRTPIQCYSGLGQVRRERQRVVSWSLVPRSGYGILTPSSGVWQAMAGPIDVSATSHPRQSAPLFTTRPPLPYPCPSPPRSVTLLSGFPHPNHQTPRLAQPPPAVPILRHIELNPGAAYCFQVCLQWRCATPIIPGSYFTFGLHLAKSIPGDLNDAHLEDGKRSQPWSKMGEKVPFPSYGHLLFATEKWLSFPNNRTLARTFSSYFEFCHANRRYN